MQGFMSLSLDLLMHRSKQICYCIGWVDPIISFKANILGKKAAVHCETDYFSFKFND